MALAGLYELWRDPSLDPEAPAGWLWSCTILTTAAADPLAWLHHRMPLILNPDRQAAWLDPAQKNPGQLDELAAPTAGLRVYPYPLRSTTRATTAPGSSTPRANRQQTPASRAGDRTPARATNPHKSWALGPGPLFCVTHFWIRPQVVSDTRRSPP